MARVATDRQKQSQSVARPVASWNRSNICEELAVLAERELTAFVAAVDMRFGPEQARQSAEDWLSSLQGSAPGEVPDFRQLTIAAASRLGYHVFTSLQSTFTENQ